MEVELLEIRDFLVLHHPFNQLSIDALNGVLGDIEIRYLRRGTDIRQDHGLMESLYLIRTGAVELQGHDGELLARLAEGDMFGYRASPREEQDDIRGKVIEDCLVYQFPASAVDDLCEQHPQLDYFLAPVGGDRLRDAITHVGDDSNSQLSMMTTRIRDLITREPVIMPPTATIRETAVAMSEERVSSILITQEEMLQGIVTDRDLRNRVVAKGLDYDLPVTEIMTGETCTADINDYAFEAQLQMARQNIHHLPVLDEEKVAGMLTATDLTKHHTTSAVYMVSDIHKQNDIESLQEISTKSADLLVNLAAADVTADSAGHVITSVVDALTCRLIKLAEDQLGSPPVPYAWLAAGSQARSEQTAKSDQDNCLLLDDSYDEKKHGEYFQQLARFVCDGLDACGYFYCPGEMMAITDKWRQPLHAWKKYFSKWIDQPEPKALMLTCVFFDLRCVCGDRSLFRGLRKYLQEKCRGNRIFLAHMAGNALTHRPPLGFFRNFVLIHGGTHDLTFDLKHTGIVPIVDLARVYSLAAGINLVNTQDRLKAVAEGGEVSEEGARDLQDTLEFVSFLRIEHQARQIRAGEDADNFMSPKDLSNFERNHLKDAFSVVRTMQNVLSQRYKI
ncbi:MAG: cyclic nucleotide-binding/CBS domain-containing protein [Gammaproteobacteria bacterium]|nr:cyclic nucleotide-binding/CBS domain-containing protein [Gammaproteobacteria bacterium]